MSGSALGHHSGTPLPITILHIVMLATRMAQHRAAAAGDVQACSGAFVSSKRAASISALPRSGRIVISVAVAHSFTPLNAQFVGVPRLGRTPLMPLG